jgi:membrane-bound lytic murein transglycosylase B
VASRIGPLTSQLPWLPCGYVRWAVVTAFALGLVAGHGTTAHGFDPGTAARVAGAGTVAGAKAQDPEAARPPFAEWLAGVRAEAAERGIRAETLEAALADLAPVEQVQQRDRSQAEFVLSFDAYVKRWLSRSFVRAGREKKRLHAALLAKVGTRYGVPPHVLVALWGVESNYGRFSGVRPVIATLATLAYDPRRAAFFRAELLDALSIVDRGDIELARMRGSWAGAMGQPQFMPSSYLKYAQDFDGDGRRDIWGTPADVLASMANYLSQRGWQQGRLWGREVVIRPTAELGVASVPIRETGCRAERDMSEARPMREWQRLGVRLPRGKALPGRAPDASLVRVGARAFLVHRNYEVLLQYNCAHHYALGVSLLSERLR